MVNLILKDTIDYRNKLRDLYVGLLDGHIRKLRVDDSQTVGQLMIDICSSMGIANYEEYSLINDIADMEKEKNATLKKVSWQFFIFFFES